jgi:glycosyltransferase involved in cell wall biosynthesis
VASASGGAVTVVVIAYNDAANVADAVAEVIVVDDASTDDTPRVLERSTSTEPKLPLSCRGVAPLMVARRRGSPNGSGSAPAGGVLSR